MSTSRISVRGQKWALMTLLFAACAIVYAHSMDQDYVWDDHVVVERDARCQGHLLQCLKLPFMPTTPFADLAPAYYRPIVTMSFAALGEAHQQHSLNLLLHAINALLLFSLLGRYGAPPIRAFAGAFVWAMHPRLVEAVSWISGRTDVLCATFLFTALRLWPPDATKEPYARFDRARLLACSILLGLALGTKEVAIAGILALAWTSRKNRARWPYLLVPVLVYSAARISIIGLKTPPSSLTAAQRVPTTLESVARYVEMIARFDRPWGARGAVGVIEPLHAVLGAVTIALIGYCAWRFRDRLHAAGVVIGIVSTLAVAHIVPIGVLGALTADRFLYFPLAGLILATATLRADRVVISGALVALGLAEAWVTRKTVRSWDDELRLWFVVAERADPSNVGPRGSLAAIVRERGAPELACPLFESSRRTLANTNRQQTPAYRRASENLAACWSIIGRYDDSAALYRETLAAFPTHGRTALGLGYAEMHRFDFAASTAAFTKAGTLDPSLRPLAQKMLEELETAQHERGDLTSSDASKRARYQLSVGRWVEAEREYISVAKDESQPRPVRVDALNQLLPIATAKGAREAQSSLRDPDLEPFVKHKEQWRKQLTDATPQLQSLAL